MRLLDACALLMLADDQSLLSDKALRLIEESEDLTISAISAFKIILKYKLGKLSLPLPPEEWFDLALQTHGIRAISIDVPIAGLSARLPFIHKDPCDRIIIATAMINNAILLTADKTIPRYPDVRIAW